MLCAAGVLANDVSTPGSMVLSFIPALPLRRRSAFPRALVPNAAFGLAQTRRWPIRRASANALRRQFVGADSQGRAEATRARVETVSTTRCNVRLIASLTRDTAR